MNLTIIWFLIVSFSHCGEYLKLESKYHYENTAFYIVKILDPDKARIYLLFTIYIRNYNSHLILSQSEMKNRWISIEEGDISEEVVSNS